VARNHGRRGARDGVVDAQLVAGESVERLNRSPSWRNRFPRRAQAHSNWHGKRSGKRHRPSKSFKLFRPRNVVQPTKLPAADFRRRACHCGPRSKAVPFFPRSFTNPGGDWLVPRVPHPGPSALKLSYCAVSFGVSSLGHGLQRTPVSGCSRPPRLQGGQAVVMREARPSNKASQAPDSAHSAQRFHGGLAGHRDSDTVIH
jgi:hypothetical protein